LVFILSTERRWESALLHWFGGNGFEQIAALLREQISPSARVCIFLSQILDGSIKPYNHKGGLSLSSIEAKISRNNLIRYAFRSGMSTRKPVATYSKKRTGIREGARENVIASVADSFGLSDSAVKKIVDSENDGGSLEAIQLAFSKIYFNP
jgi:hypothetical protein